jgi:hypothetical protein
VTPRTNHTRKRRVRLKESGTDEPKERQKEEQYVGSRGAQMQLEGTKIRKRTGDPRSLPQTGLTAQVYNFDALRALQNVQSFVGKADMEPQAEPSQPDRKGLRYFKSLSVPKATQIIAVCNMAHLLQREAFYLRRVAAQVC